MVCSQCATVNEAGRKFCRECGVRLSSACSSCGAANQPDDKFCGECGTPLTAQPAASDVASSGAPGKPGDATERRLVSVLFVDLVGFTSFSEGRDAEDVRAMLSRYFDAASDAVQRHGGSVEKFIGDAVMAVWGTPVAHEDDAERAVRSALEIVDRVHVLGTELSLPLQARAGVLTGEAVASLNATDQGFVTGDLVNTASRLQSVAEPGTVLVGERTQRATNQSIAYEAVEPLTVKGKEEKVPAYLALRILSELGGSGRGTAPEPPFVGRDEQLRHTKELLHATGREGRPRLLHISGVAGIGKSRLVWELLKYLDGLTADTYWHAGRCPSYGDGVTFWALAEMVRTRAGIADTDDDETSRSRLTACLAEYVPDTDERRWIEPRLGHLLGLDPAPSGDREELFGAWRRFFERVAEHGTVVLVIEDLHWADPGLMDFLESMLGASRSSPILVMTLARPELMDRRPTWGHGVRSSSVLHLDRLDDDEIRTMVTSYVDGLPAAGLQRLVDRAEGVPMYAVETVRVLADRGVLEQRGSAYVAVGELGGELDIPETLHALVAARLDGLPDLERTLVQDCSVAGHSFTIAMAAAVNGRSETEVEPLLRQLVRKEVLDQDVDPRSPERGHHRFVQSVIKEVAYSTLSKAARRTKHLACARWLSGLTDEELVGVVASHYLEAYRADPSADDSEDVATRARLWLQKAGDRALSLGSPTLALGYATQAISLATTPKERGPLHQRATEAAVLINDVDTAWEQHLRAVEAYRATGDVLAEVSLLGEGAMTYVRWSQERWAPLLEEVLDLLARVPEDQPSARVRMLTTLARRENLLGHREEADRISQEALTLAQSVDDDEAIFFACGVRANVLIDLGRHWEAVLLFEGQLDLARRSGKPSRVAAVLGNLAMMNAEEDPRLGFDRFQESASIHDSIGNRAGADQAMANALEIAVDVGEWVYVDEALAEFATVESILDGDRTVLAFTECMLRSHRGEAIDALEGLARLEADWGDSWEHVQVRTWFLRTRSYVRLLAGDDSGALADVEVVLELEPTGVNAPMALWTAVQAAAATRDPARIRSVLAATTGLRGRFVRTIRRTAFATVAALDGASDAAAQATSVLDGWHDAHLPLDHAFAVLTLACALPSGGVPDEHVGEARAYLVGLGGVSLLRLIDAALESAPSA